jgi:hypothetical protein
MMLEKLTIDSVIIMQKHEHTLKAKCSNPNVTTGSICI